MTKPYNAFTSHLDPDRKSIFSKRDLAAEALRPARSKLVDEKRKAGGDAGFARSLSNAEKRNKGSVP